MKQKLSEIILEMIRPFHSEKEKHENIVKLISLAVIAWNITFLPVEEAEETLKLALKNHKGNNKQREIMRAVISDFVNFKLDKHGYDDRFILEYQFEKSDDPELFIISTQPNKDTFQAPVTVIKTGRNEPCPCGSGKKYKKCCLI